ncbi:hypothetical protein INT46_010106, partial [Mucor plumbeus]
MSIKINLEDTISFERPLTRVVKQSVTIQNPNDKPIAFKVKTTAPKLYCVRPNSDIIPPNGSIDVQIMLQAQREEPPFDVKCRDKFLILSTFVNSKTEDMDISKLWSYVEENEKSSIHQHKLRCVYVQSGANVDPQPKSTATAAAPVAAAPVAARSIPNNSQSSNIKEQEQQDAIEKVKKLEKELNKYKEAETLREAESLVVEK